MSNIKPHIRISAMAVSPTFVNDVRAIIEQGKQQAYMSVNASMIETYYILTFGNRGFQINNI